MLKQAVCIVASELEEAKSFYWAKQFSDLEKIY
jgi:hypothetical protein